MPPASTLLHHQRGALLGLACGDAFGTTQEFTKPRNQPPLSPSSLITGPQTEVVGGGPFHVRPGQVTDDTQMAVTLHRHLQQHGRIEGPGLFSAYQAWAAHAFDIGNLTAQSLNSSGQQAWECSHRNSAGNGSLMRTAPIGVQLYLSPERILEASLADSALTHFDPRCQLACAVFNQLIGAALRAVAAGQALAPAQMLSVANAALETAATQLTTRHAGIADWIAVLRRAQQDLATDIQQAQADELAIYGEGRDALHIHAAAGFVRVAFRLALWYALHQVPYRAAIIDVVNRGGDSDTNGAIVGALLGALQGEHAIPQAWWLLVFTALIEQPTSVWRSSYHPREFISLGESND